MSAAVVVVEAADQGGALITARLAAEIGRPVFVVPGDVDRPASVGCNRLIKDGAHPVLGIADLIAELSLVLGPPRIGGSRAVEASIPLGGIHIEELADHWSITTSQALVRLAEMEIAGMIRRIGGAVFPA
jgi:DNA processing protein